MNTANLRDLAIKLAEGAGEFITAHRPAQVTVASTKSSATDPVTEMDRAVEAWLVERIQAERPDDAILGEEGAGVAGTSGLTWVIDPIDGTVNYVYGVASFAVSVAVVSGEPDPLSWQAQAGAVRDVVTGRTWAAAHGLGALRDGTPIVPPAAVPLAECLTGTGFGYAATQRAEQARILSEVLPRVRDIRRLGSAAVDLCLVADGTLDLYYEQGLNPWDLAAGALIAAEAGCAVTGLEGRPPSAAMTVAGRGQAARDLLAILAEATRKE